MVSDIAGMLRRIANDVFDSDVDVTIAPQPGAPHISRASLHAETALGRRTVGLRASTTGFFEITIIDLGVSAALCEYDDESYMEAILRQLALVADAYLRGAGRIDHKRNLIRTTPVLTIEVNDRKWVLGRRQSVVHYP